MTIKDKGILSGIDISEKDNERISIYGMYNNSKDHKLEEEETYRTIFRRDRDRILYSGGFRRLQDKTQVISAVKNGDHRTRLTHTLEVEQIAVSISDALALNKDLTSAIALGHDVGHTPFGHAVERFLDKKLKDEGGFSHALQSVRYFKEKEIEFSDEIIEGILKHDTDSFTHNFLEGEKKCRQLKSEKTYYTGMPPGTLEAQVVYWADKLAYITHDFEDFCKNGLLERSIDINSRLKSELDGIFKEITKKGIFDEKGCISSYVKTNPIRDLIRNLVQDLVKESDIRIKKYIINEVNRCSADGKECIQNIIRDKTNELIEEIYSSDNQYKILEKIKVNKLIDLDKKKNLNNINNINKLLEYYSSSKENKEIIKDINYILDKGNEMDNLKRELKEVERSNCFTEKIKNNIQKIKRYGELSDIKVDIFEKQKNKIKKEAYKNGLIINLSEDTMQKYNKLRNIIDDNYIFSQMIQLSDAKAEKIVESLYNMYLENINILPIEFKKRIIQNKVDKKRIIADYISSMSDRYAEEIYMNLNTTGSDYSY